MLRYLATLSVLCLLSAGCMNPQIRAQMQEETDKERDLDVRTIGDVTEVGNTATMKVQGVGLVTGLSGTGHCPAGAYRSLLEQYLLKALGTRGGEIEENPQRKRVSQILNDPDNALVIVTGYIPPGARRGDRFDVEVTLPDGSKTTSLAGGYLQLSLLRVYQAASSLSERHANSNALLPSQVFGQAKGLLIVGLSGNSDAEELKHARIWQGGMSRTERSYAFLMKTDEKSVKISNAVADRINYMYQEDPRSRALSEQQKQILALGTVTDQLNQRTGANGMVDAEMARAINKEAINIRVPFAYRHNHARYIRVARFTPIDDKDPNLQRYRKRLQKMLHDPRDTVRAAMRLEAMGRDTIPIFKEALDSEYALVRFAAGEALAYLGSTAGVEPLFEVAQRHPLFAQHVCMALANLSETVCRDRLAALLASTEPTVRTAAFHALTLIDETDLRLGGQYINETFWLHRIPQAPAPIVYFSTSKRPQVLLFGRNIRMQPDSRIYVNEFTIVTHASDDQCIVKRINARGEEQRASTQRLDDILTALTHLGATYPEIVEFLRKAHDYRKLNSPIANWSQPETALETLIEVGRDLR